MMAFSIFYLFVISTHIELPEIIKYSAVLMFIIFATIPNIKERIYSDKLNFSIMGLGVVLNLLLAIGYLYYLKYYYSKILVILPLPHLVYLLHLLFLLQSLYSRHWKEQSLLLRSHTMHSTWEYSYSSAAL